jgi:anti-sigma-K factor RskA
MTTLTHDDARDLVGVFALDAIDDGAERELVERHVADCPECRGELAELREALAQLTAADAPAPGPVWARIRDEIAAEAAVEGPAAPVVPLRRRLRGVALGAAAVAAAVALTVVAMRDGGLGRPAVTAEVVPAEDAELAGLRGTVSVFEPDRPGGRIRISLSNVPDAPPGHHYAVWVLRPGEEVEMEAVGAFTPEAGRAVLELSLPGPGEYVALDISVEDDGGSPEHSGTSLAGATLSS